MKAQRFAVLVIVLLSVLCVCGACNLSVLVALLFK